MPRLKLVKLQGLQAFVCWHPTESLLGEHDEWGRQRCGKCGHKITTVLTRKAFEEYTASALKAWTTSL